MTLTEPGTAVALTEVPERVFSVSICISAIRCTLTYVLFPWILPVLGVAGGVGPGIGLAIGTVAIAANMLTIRRFWVADHRWKVPVTVISAGIIVLLSILVVIDFGDLL